ncbi:MAG TPA: chromate efflux transporter [Thermoanaerobaculia bacterium]|nr:chromate efflux transporter [Thermoanaerobaculia bacterium]
MTDSTSTLPTPPTFRQALAYWARLGWINFGGPAGQIALMHRDLVDRLRWVGEKQFLTGLDVCMLLPGPEAQQLATHLGWRLHGIRGGIAAGTLFVLPSVAVLLVLSWIYVRFGQVSAVAALLAGIKPVVVAIVAAAMVRIGRRALKTPFHVALAVLALVAIALLGVPFPAIVAGAALTGFLVARVRGEPALAAGLSGSETVTERAPQGRRWRRLLGGALLLWLVPAVGLWLVRGAAPLPFDLYLFFTQAAFVTFGGAYAVLAYVADAATAAGWLSRAATIDGLALAETTPGPLIVVLQFVGFVAGWNQPGGLSPLAGALLAALATSWATFLPSTVLGLAIGPWVDRLESWRGARAALAAVSAAVVGVIASLGLLLAREVLLPASGGLDLFALAILAAALLALVRWHVEAHWAIVAGALAGLLRG